MSNVIPFRRPTGSPTGGQFATTQRGEADVDLGLAPPAVAAASAIPSEPTVSGSEMYPERKGSKYTGYRDAALIAKDVRTDIKAALKSGELPTSAGGHDVTYSVTCDKYSGGQAVNVEVRGLADADIYDGRDDYGNRKSSQAARQIKDRVEAIAGAYNKSATNSQIDYFSETYYSRVRIEDESGAAFRLHEKSTKATAAEFRRAHAAGASEDVLGPIRARHDAIEAAYREGRDERNRAEEAGQREHRDAVAGGQR